MYFENLDGLRSIAFLMIFCAHALGTSDEALRETSFYHVVEFLKAPCWLGVPFFFVLSGFLITYLLLREKEKSGSIALKKFYARRVLRIWPLYIVLMLIGFVLFPILQEQFVGGATQPNMIEWKYWAFLSNFDQIDNGLPNIPGIVVAWSLAVEEQFYLIWPILMLVVPSRYYLHLMLALIVISVAYRIGWNGHEKHTISCVLDLSAGGLLAVLYAQGGAIFQRFTSMPKQAIVLVYFVGLAILFMHHHIAISLRFLVTLFMCFVIFEQSFAHHSFFKMKNAKLLSQWGKMTYGLYLLHAIALFISHNLIERTITATPLIADYLLKPLLALTLSLIMAYFAYHYFERYFLTFKDRFRS